MSKLMRDIIDVPVVETVVRLDDATALTKRDGVVREFVLTRQVERNLRSIAQSIKEDRGGGCFLTGPYGSGKSHFLSYVSLVLSGEVERNIKCPLGEAMSGKRFMPIRVSLINVRNDRRLEDAMLAEAERYIRATGAKIDLTKRSRFIDHIDSVVRPIDSIGMDAYLVSHNLPVWEKLMEDPDKAAVSAWGYVKTLSGHPGMSEITPAELLSQIVRSAKQLGFEGVVIVIDELSEFLRSKPSRVTLNEDARYLQLIGEVAQTEKLIIVASLQEAIEQTGDIARDAIAKIKDRYPVKLALDEQHIRDLIDGRLIRKKDGARERIREVWLKYTESLPNFKIDFEDFYRIYPIHPATIRYLEGLKTLLSAHRGVVDFIVSEVRGDAKRGMAGLLERSAENLVTVDMIYEHFRSRIREDGRFAEFDTLVRRDLHNAVDKIFKDDGDRKLAIRACDILILNKIAELEKPKSVAELAQMLLMTISIVSPKANEQYLADVILEPIFKESLFIRATQHEQAEKRVFDVSLERDSRGLFQKELDRVLSAVLPDDRRIIQSVFSSVESEVLVRATMSGAPQDMIVSWRGTQRRGKIWWAEQEISDADTDFIVVLCPPDFKISNDEKLSERAIMWIPIFDKNELIEMRKFYATKILAEDAGVERTVREEAARELDGKKRVVSGLIESGFKNGRFIRSGIIEECSFISGSSAGFLERFLTRPVIDLLKQLHPKFLEVAPEIDFVSRRTLTPLIEAIIVHGKITMAAARKNNSRTMIEGVLIPMGLACVHGPAFVMQADPARSSLVRDTIDKIGKSGKVTELIDHLQHGQYGLSKELAELLIIVLVHAGLVEVKKGGRRIPSGIVGFSHVEEAEEICAGELLPLPLRKRLFADPFLSQGLDIGTFSLSSQREIWERLTSARDRLKAYSQKVLPELLAISKYPVFDGFDFNKARYVVERGLEAVSCVEDSKGSAKGLALYFTSEKPNLEEILAEVAALDNFTTNDSERVVRAADYLRDISLETDMPDEVDGAFSEVKSGLANLTDIVLKNKTSEVFSAFNRFLELYTSWYVGEHRRAFATELFEPIRKLRDSKSWQTLLLVNRISSIHLIDDASAIGKRIDSSLSLSCTRTPSVDLRIRPRCNCGFVPGKIIKLENATVIEGSINDGLKEACNALSSADVLERLVARISALKDIDSAVAGAIEEIFHKLRDGLAVKELIGFLTPETAKLLDDALKREVTIVQRNVEDLSKKLSGRKFPPERIREIFNEWLGNCGLGEVVVDLGSDNKGDTSIESMLAGWILDHKLEDVGARRALVIPQNVKASPPADGLIVDENKLKKMMELTNLVNADGDTALKVLSREKRCRSFAWASAKRLIEHLIDGWAPSDDAGSHCDFEDVKKWCGSAILVAKPFLNKDINELMCAEAMREHSMSFLNEHYLINDFPNQQTIKRLHSIMLQRIVSRDRVFSDLQDWTVRFDEMMEKYSGSIFLFLDAVRWDIITRLDEFIREHVADITVLDKKWYRTNNASTASWQEAVFGTSDLDAIAAMFKNRGIQYFADAERLDVRKRMKEESHSGSVWLRVGSVDRTIHSTSMPLHQLLDASVAELSDVAADVLPFIKSGRRLVILTDHGFSETSTKGCRYRHDPSSPADALAAMIVYA